MRAAAARGGDMGVRLAAPAAGFIAAAGLLLDRCPGPADGRLLGHAALLIAFLDMLGLALLLVGVAALVAARHGAFLLRMGKSKNAWRGNNIRGWPAIDNSRRRRTPR